MKSGSNLIAYLVLAGKPIFEHARQCTNMQDSVLQYFNAKMECKRHFASKALPQPVLAPSFQEENQEERHCRYGPMYKWLPFPSFQTHNGYFHGNTASSLEASE